MPNADDIDFDLYVLPSRVYDVGRGDRLVLFWLYCACSGDRNVAGAFPGLLLPRQQDQLAFAAAVAFVP